MYCDPEGTPSTILCCVGADLDRLSSGVSSRGSSSRAGADFERCGRVASGSGEGPRPKGRSVEGSILNGTGLGELNLGPCPRRLSFRKSGLREPDLEGSDPGSPD